MSTQTKGRPSDFRDFLLWEHSSKDTIDFKKIYVDICGGNVNAGLLFSQILYWRLPRKDKGPEDTKLSVEKHDRLWLAKSDKEWYAETRLTPKQAMTARKIIEECGLITCRTIKWKGNPTTHISINEGAFLAAWEEMLATPLETRNAGPIKPKMKALGAKKPGSKPTSGNRKTQPGEASESETTPEMASEEKSDGTAEAPQEESGYYRKGNNEITERVITKLPKGQFQDYQKGNSGITERVISLTESTPEISSESSSEIPAESGGAKTLKENAHAQASAGDPSPADPAAAPCTTTDQASLQQNVAPDQASTAQALLEPPDTRPLEAPVPPVGGAAHAANDLALTDEDVDELFGPENVNDTSPKKVPAAAGGAAPALRVADLVAIPRVELAERPAAVPSSPEYRMIRSLVTGKQLDAGLLEQATPTGGLNRQDWLRLTLDEISLVKTAAQSEAQAEGTGFVTLAIRGLDRMIGAVRREAPSQAEAGGQNPDAIAKYDPKLSAGSRCTVAGQLGVIHQVSHLGYLVDLDDGERITVDRAVAAQLKRLKASAAPAPEAPVSRDAKPDALGAVGSLWRPKAGGDPLEVTAVEGAVRVMSDKSRVPVYALTSKFIPA